VHRHRGGRHFWFTARARVTDLNAQQLRTRLRESRERLGAAERIGAAQAVLSSLEQLPEFLVDIRVAGYWAVRGEVPLNLVYARTRAREQIYHLPILHDDKTLGFAPWKNGDAVTLNRYGISEPDASTAVDANTLELVLVPLLGFDRLGNRLGSGAGYYDRTFAFLKGKSRPARPLLVGIGYHFQEVATMSPNPWDIQMDFIATDRELIDCTKSETP
jgi:5-formyltetrahydrofolate cyclo-ligase